MRNRSETWIEVVSSNEFNMETVVRIYGATGDDSDAVVGFDTIGEYKEYNTITSPIITRNLLGGDVISVGNCTIGTLNFSILTTDAIPKSARMVVRSRPYLNDIYAEWMNFGTFYIDERSSVDDLTTIIAYDSMKMGNQVYSDDSITRKWPKAIKTVVTRIAQQMGVGIDSRTMSEIINSSIGDMEVVLKPDDNSSLLDILAHIGGILGGNWTITPDDKLRFIALTTIPENTNYIIDNDGEYNYISTEGGNAIIWAPNDSQEGEGGNVEVVDVNVVLGSFDTSRQYSISKVTMSIDEDHVYSYGDTSGFELLIEDNPYATPGLCKALYESAAGIVYAPFNMENACYDPAAELGDGLIIHAEEPIASILFNEVRTFDIVFRANASAPGEDETESEYPYKTAYQRMKYEIQDATVQLGRELRSVISQTQTEIMQTVSDVYVTKEDSDIVELSTASKIAQSANSIMLTVSRNFTTKGETREVQSSIEQTADKILLTVSDNYTTKEDSEKTSQMLMSTIEQTAGAIRFTVQETTRVLDGRLTNAETSLSLIPGELEAKVSKDGVIASINASATGPESSVKINADRINITGLVTFTDLSTQNERTEIHGGNIKANTITLSSLTQNDRSAIYNATAEQQYIYLSQAQIGSVAPNTTWVTNSTGNQNVWTTVRPRYDQDYPVLYVAVQRQKVEQDILDPDECECTQPVVDQTTTVIDGSKILTGSIQAGAIAANTITVSKLTGNISNSGWVINFDNGTLTIGSISVSKITGNTGTDSAGWGINFDTGDFTIGNISANKLTAGTINANNVTIRGYYVNGSTLDLDDYVEFKNNYLVWNGSRYTGSLGLSGDPNVLPSNRVLSLYSRYNPIEIHSGLYTSIKRMINSAHSYTDPGYSLVVENGGVQIKSAATNKTGLDVTGGISINNGQYTGMGYKTIDYLRSTNPDRFSRMVFRDGLLTDQYDLTS